MSPNNVKGAGHLVSGVKVAVHWRSKSTQYVGRNLTTMKSIHVCASVGRVQLAVDLRDDNAPV